MHLFLAAIKRKVSSQLPRVPSGARHQRRFTVLHQREKETLPNFYRRFLQLQAQALEVSNDQVIAQAIRALRARPLHSYLVRERPKIVLELYEQFTKFSKSEVQHFRKLEQQRKVLKPDEATRPCYNDNQCSYPKPVHSIDSDGCGLPKNWEKHFGPSPQERNPRTFDQRSPHTAKEAELQILAAIVAEAHTQRSPILHISRQ
jgi:hypothetical protein